MDERLRVCRSAKEAIPSLSTCIPEALDAGDNLDGSRRFIMSRFVWHDLDKTKTFETLWSLGLDIISIHRLCPSLRAKHVPSFVASTIVLPWMNVNLCLRHLRKHRVTLTLPCSSTGPGSVSGGGASPGGAEGEPDHECGATTPWRFRVHLHKHEKRKYDMSKA